MVENLTTSKQSRMSPKRRFLSAMLGGKPDQLPVGNVVSVATVEQMRMVDAWFPEAHLDPQIMSTFGCSKL